MHHRLQLLIDEPNLSLARCRPPQSRITKEFFDLLAYHRLHPLKRHFILLTLKVKRFARIFRHFQPGVEFVDAAVHATLLTWVVRHRVLPEVRDAPLMAEQEPIAAYEMEALAEDNDLSVAHAGEGWRRWRLHIFFLFNVCVCYIAILRMLFRTVEQEHEKR